MTCVSYAFASATRRLKEASKSMYPSNSSSSLSSESIASNKLSVWRLVMLWGARAASMKLRSGKILSRSRRLESPLAINN